MSTDSDITRLLQAWRGGNQSALEELTPLIYSELRRLARREMRHEGRAITLQTSALVNEAFLRLTGSNPVDWQNRAHFFGVSSRLMRQILVDFARSRRADKRGGALAIHVPIEEASSVADNAGAPADADLVALDEALTELATLDPRRAQIVEFRFFGGLSIEETAEALDVSPGTVRRDWRLARAWLYRALSQR